MSIQSWLIALQAFQVAVLWLHDWVPLGRLNDPAAVRRENGTRHLVRTTLVQSVPWTFGLLASIAYASSPYPTWLWAWLWGSHVVLLLGEIRAWWWPYLGRPDPVLAQRYGRMFGGTHSFLPIRHGLVPNTLHVALHTATLLTVLTLTCIRFG